MFKKVLSSIVVIGMLSASMPAFSGFGSSSSSRSSSPSAPARSTPSYSAPVSRPAPTQSSTPSNFGGGKPLGMQRSEITQQARPATPASAAPQAQQSVGSGSTTTVNNYRNYPDRRDYDQGRYGVGSLAAAAAAGGLVGYALHSNNGQPYYTSNSQPGVFLDGNGNVMSQNPTVVSPGYVSSGSTSVFTIIFGIIVLLIIGGIAIAVVRRL